MRATSSRLYAISARNAIAALALLGATPAAAESTAAAEEAIETGSLEARSPELVFGPPARKIGAGALSVAPPRTVLGPTLGAATADDCAAKPDALGVTRVVTIDASEGRHYGAGRKGYHSTRAWLEPGEVVLTFDDGPSKRATRDILATLREFCVKATFFVPGRAAVANPDILQEIAADGHTIAGHSYSHPMPFADRSKAEAIDEIERGFEALHRELGRRPASLFRFPGLSDSAALLDYLSERGVASLSIDVDSRDTRRGATAETVISGTLDRVAARKGGVVLFHDPLRRTAKALPTILRALKKGGYKIVHLRTASPYLAPDEKSTPVAGAARKWARPSFREITPPAISAIY